MAISKRIPYTPVTLMVIRLEEVMTYKSLQTVIIQISATRTVHRERLQLWKRFCPKIPGRKVSIQSG